jgi:hypothetical protein
MLCPCHKHPNLHDKCLGGKKGQASVGKDHEVESASANDVEEEDKQR